MLKISFFSLLITITAIGCVRSDRQYGPIVYRSWGIILNPSNNPVQLSFDWNMPNKSTISNINSFASNINLLADSTRILANYYFSSPPDSTKVALLRMYYFLTKKLQSYSITNNTDTFGNNIIYSIPSFSFYPSKPFFEHNYLSIPFSTYYSPTSNITHRISLVYNSDNPTNLWSNGKDTMYVELRHNAKGDTINAYSISSDWVAFNLNGLRPQNAPDSFKIQISYITFNQSTGNKNNQKYIVPAKWQ